MGVKFLQDLVENGLLPNSVGPVDLIQLGISMAEDVEIEPRKPGTAPKLGLVLDGECCLNRLYGGYFPDWVCGGQWNQMACFIRDLVRHLNNANIELVVFLNGAIEPQRMDEWIANQKEQYTKIQQILNHVNRKHTPPPKAWWIPPVGLRMAIRMMLRQLNVNVVCTIDDHRQEVIAYCRENNFHGIIADDAEYIAFDPPRLFSASQMKLTYHGNLHTKEYLISHLMRELQLNNEKLCVLAALLGNYLLPEKSLQDVYKSANIDVLTENTAETVVRKLAKYINEINISSDLDEIVVQIFHSANDPRSAVLKQSIQYYLNGTKDGFLKYRSVSSGSRSKIPEKSAAANADTSQEPDLDTSALASEIAGNEKNIIYSYPESTACLNSGQDDTKLDSPNSADNSVHDDSFGEVKSPPSKKEISIPVLPQVSHEVMRTLSDRHSKGLMSPYIYQILSQGEIKLPVVMEDGNEIPNIYAFYKPIRQMVYAIVFNLHHHKFMAQKENKPLDVDIRIKEWIFNKTDKVHKSEYVKAEPVGWGVPTIQRLWFGTLQDDKRRRLRAFLTCMRSDAQLILHPDFVPQHLLVAAVVLRYMMSFPDKKVLRKQELDAFIVAALCPEFNDNAFIQDCQVKISSRSLQLAAMFMKGIETALLVNDACGAPVPWLVCGPWSFFNGKLFHYMCQKATTCKHLQELCANRLGLVLRAERMRQAILEGLTVQFARPTFIPSVLPNADANSAYGRYLNRMPVSPSVSVSPSGMNRTMAAGAGRGRRSLGGKLEVAGVVVGSWGANHSVPQTSYEMQSYMMPPPPVSSIAGEYNNFGYRARSAYIPRPKGKSFKSAYGNRKKPVKKEKKAGRGRGLTIGSSSGSSILEVSSQKIRENGDKAKSNSVESDLLNGNDSTTTDRFEDGVLNGTVGFLGEGDTPSTLKTKHETSSSLVGAATK